MGAYDGTNQWGLAAGHPWGFGGGSADKKNWITDGIAVQSMGFGNDYKINATSLDSDGFTFNISATNGTAYVLNYMLLGGSDISVKVGVMSVTTGTGSQSFTPLSFTPKAMICCGGISNQTTGESGNANWSLGIATSSSNRYNISQHGSATNPTQEGRMLISTKWGGRLVPNKTVGYDWDFTSMDGSGWTINKTTSTGATIDQGYIALGGTAQYYLTSFTQKTSTGTQARTGFGFSPVGLFFAGAQGASSASIVADAGLTIGAASGTTARAVISGTAYDNFSNNTSACSRQSNAAIIQAGHIASPGSSTTTTVDAEADLNSLDSDGYTENWTTADATAREFVVLGIGSAASTTNTSRMMGFF